MYRLTGYLLFALLSILSPLPSWGVSVSGHDIKKELKRLDRELKLRDTYIAGRQSLIDSLRHEVSRDSTHNAAWLGKVMNLADSYNSFNMDSALYYYTAGYNRSTELNIDSLATAFKLRRASVYPVVAFINNAIDDFNSIDTTKMAPGLKPLYHNTGRQMYSYISSFYENYPAESAQYSQLAISAQGSLLGILPHDSPLYKLNLGEYFYYSQDFMNAKIVLQELMDELDETDNTYARAAHIMSDISKEQGNHDEYIYYLTRSAIADTKSATLEVNSLQQLGEVLFDDGDVDRAYTYILYALDGAVKGHAKMRLSQTAESMPIIEQAHRSELKRSHHRIMMIMGMMGLLLVILLVTVWFIRREMKSMTILHQRLETANQIKDIYMSQFLSLCSIYMEKLNQLCKITNRKISAGQVDELYKMTKSGKFVEEQTREFYQVFDDAFLHIYPTFVEAVNRLLKPGEKIELEEGEKLNTDLRILAFMRMGIDDSGKIAQVLNYSVNTIYTYRNKLKNRAICRDTFESDIMKISSLG